MTPNESVSSWCKRNRCGCQGMPCGFFLKQVESSRSGERCRMKKRSQLGGGWARWKGRAGGVCDFPHYRMLLFLLCSTDRIKSQQANWPLPGADKVRRFMFSPQSWNRKTLAFYRRGKNKTIRTEAHGAFKCDCRLSTGRLAPGITSTITNEYDHRSGVGSRCQRVIKNVFVWTQTASWPLNQKSERHVFGGRAHFTSAEQQKLSRTDSSHRMNQSCWERKIPPAHYWASVKQVIWKRAKTISFGPAVQPLQCFQCCFN